MVQPDVLVVRNPNKKKYLDFPRVLIAEILSPSTAAKDRIVKMELYQMQAVKYYCILDAQFKKIEICELIQSLYELASVNPLAFEFTFENCTALINVENLWD